MYVFVGVEMKVSQEKWAKDRSLELNWENFASFSFDLSDSSEYLIAIISLCVWWDMIFSYFIKRI